MEPLSWTVVFLVVCLLVSLIASKKGRSGVKLFFAMVVPAVPLMLLVSAGLGNNMAAKPLAMWSAAFLCPVVGFFWALMTPNQAQVAQATGQYGDMKKCPFCAEPVRREAIKCKHCGSDLVDHAARATMAERAEREAAAAKLHADELTAKPKGTCPNCTALIPLDSLSCSKCQAGFGPGSAWTVKPLKHGVV